MNQKSLAVWVLFFAAVLSTVKTFANDDPPGVIINKNPDPKTQIIGSHSLAILPSGTYIATHGYYRPKTKEYETLVFSSRNHGQSWVQISAFEGQCWSTVFAHRDALYLMGATKQWGNLVIRRSNDEGKTWTNPADEKTGLLSNKTQYRATPVSMPVHDGRIWRAVEKFEKNKYRVLVISAPEDSDLLDASNWLMSESLEVAANFLGGPKDRLYDGSILQAPDGSLVNVLRAQAAESRAAILAVSSDGSKISLNPEGTLVEFPGSKSKFTVRYDNQTRRYWSLVNQDSTPAYAFNNVLVLASSQDLRSWKVETILLQHIDSKNHGFHRSFWHFDNDDIVAVSGTSWGNGLQPNYLTFHRFKNFRTLKMEDSAPLLGDAVESKHETDDFVINGLNMRIESFRNGEKLFGNWSFKLRDIPSQFDGWSFTQINAASRADLSVTVKRDCELYFATGTEQGLIDVTGWSAVKSGNFQFSEKDESRMVIFKRSVKSGEILEIPQGSWSGGIVLIPPGS